MKDRLAELVLEDQDLPADRGLGDVKLFAGGGEGAGFSDGPDDFQLPQVHESAYMRARHESTCDDSSRAMEGSVRQRGPGAFDSLVQIAFVHLDADEAETELGAGDRCGAESQKRVGHQRVRSRPFSRRHISGSLGERWPGWGRSLSRL